MGAHGAPFVRQGLASSSSSSAIAIPFVALLSFLILSSTVDGDIIVDSLLKFKTSLVNTNELSSWNTSTPPCLGGVSNWKGVLCTYGQIWGLQLENMTLSGQIDVDSLVNIPTLRGLSFMNNSFHGPMPDWRKLGALKSLYLSNSGFSGEIPDDAFSGMLSLKKVYLANNQFTGKLPSSLSTPKLLELHVENNQFTGSIPNFQSGIKSLNVSNNQFEGPIPSSVTDMDPSSFTGNKGLCGPPLGGDCTFRTPLDDDFVDPSSPPGLPSNQTTSNKTSILKIIIIVICVLIALVALILIILVCYRSKREKREIDETATYTQKTMSPTAVQVVEAAPRVEVSAKARKADSGKLSFVREDRERFDLQDLLRASAEVLGSGNFGSSYKAVLLDGQAVVVKRFKQMTNVGREDFHEHMRRLGRLRHPNLLPLVAYYYRKEEKLLVSDYVINGSLAGRLHGNHTEEKPVLDWPTRLKIVKGVAKGLVFLQDELPSLPLSNGHLKSSNVLLDKDFNPLMMDYALAPVVNTAQVSQLLVAYKSPEYAQSVKVSKKTDVWCLGILILEIITSKLPANYVAQRASDLAGWVNPIIRDESIEVYDKEMGNRENCEGEMLKLLKIGAACCEEDPEKRWDMKEAFEKIEELKERDH